METIRIREQITALRKARGMTQEELAQALGVSNQAVSKWETGQCCPDIQLVPALARLFSVSIDCLLGVAPAGDANAAPAWLQQAADTRTEEQTLLMLHRMMASLHAGVVQKIMEKNAKVPEITGDHGQEQAADGAWGYTILTAGAGVTAMRGGAVFSADKARLQLDAPAMQRVARLTRTFGNAQTLSVAVALYTQTTDEKTYADAESVAAQCGLPESAVQACLCGALLPYLEARADPDGVRYRFDDSFAAVVPLLSLLDCR